MINAYDDKMISNFAYMMSFSISYSQGWIHPIFYGFYNTKFSDSLRIFWSKIDLKKTKKNKVKNTNTNSIRD